MKLIKNSIVFTMFLVGVVGFMGMEAGERGVENGVHSGNLLVSDQSLINTQKMKAVADQAALDNRTALHKTIGTTGYNAYRYVTGQQMVDLSGSLAGALFGKDENGRLIVTPDGGQTTYPVEMGTSGKPFYMNEKGVKISLNNYNSSGLTRDQLLKATSATRTNYLETPSEHSSLNMIDPKISENANDVTAAPVDINNRAVDSVSANNAVSTINLRLKAMNNPANSDAVKTMYNDAIVYGKERINNPCHGVVRYDYNNQQGQRITAYVNVADGRIASPAVVKILNLNDSVLHKTVAPFNRTIASKASNQNSFDIPGAIDTIFNGQPSKKSLFGYVTYTKGDATVTVNDSTGLIDNFVPSKSKFVAQTSLRVNDTTVNNQELSDRVRSNEGNKFLENYKKISSYKAENLLKAYTTIINNSNGPTFQPFKGIKKYNNATYVDRATGRIATPEVVEILTQPYNHTEHNYLDNPEVLDAIFNGTKTETGWANPYEIYTKGNVKVKVYAKRAYDLNHQPVYDTVGYIQDVTGLSNVSPHELGLKA